jgi:hypothetical protein
MLVTVLKVSRARCRAGRLDEKKGCFPKPPSPASGLSLPSHYPACHCLCGHSLALDDRFRVTGYRVVISPERTDEDWPPENFLISDQAIKRRIAPAADSICQPCVCSDTYGPQSQSRTAASGTKDSETDTSPKVETHQSYRSRERDSTDSFTDSEKKQSLCRFRCSMLLSGSLFWCRSPLPLSFLSPPFCTFSSATYLSNSAR